MDKLFAQPYFVTPHAVQRFRERVADIPPARVIEVVQEMLQDPGLPVDAEIRDGKLALIYRARYAGKTVYLTVGRGDAAGEDKPWPAVITVMSEESVLHGVLCRVDTKRGRRWRYEDRKALIVPLREAGFTVRECAAILRVSHTTVERHIKRLGLAKRRSRRWKPREIATLCRLREQGVPGAEIAAKLDRSVIAVRVKLSRLYRRYAAARADPERQAVLRVLATCLDPGKVLSMARRAGLLDQLKRAVVESEVESCESRRVP